MTALGHRFAANLIGVGGTAAMQLAFTPLFLRLVGVEGYGFIGFFVMLQSLLLVLDFGFAPTIGRQLARFVAGKEEPLATRDLARTLELASWALAAAGAVALSLLAGPAGRWWFAAATLAPARVARVLACMAWALAAQWPRSFYESGLLGLGRPVAMNVVRLAAAVLSAVGAALVLLYLSAGVAGYFAAQAIVAVAQGVALRTLFWRRLDPARGGRFRAAALRGARRFAAGMTGITLLGVLVTQADRLIVSRLASLTDFGYYALAGVVAGSLGLIVIPAHNTLFPQFSALFAGEREALRHAYHRGAQLLSVLLLPLACVVAVFAQPLLWAWSGDAALAARTAPLATLLAVGTALNGLMHPPYALQLASGSTRLPLLLCVGQLLFMVPVVTALALRHGVDGAALGWPAMNLLYLLVGSLTTHRLWLPGAQRRWLLADVLAPLAGALIPTLLANSLLSLPSSRLGTVAVLAVVLATALAGSAAAVAATRRRCPL